jgi:hypothetical protein
VIKKSPVRPVTLGGRDRERRDICAWLRNQARKFKDEGNPTFGLIVRDLAFEIEHGAHLRKKHA